VLNFTTHMQHRSGLRSRGRAHSGASAREPSTQGLSAITSASHKSSTELVVIQASFISILLWFTGRMESAHPLPEAHQAGPAMLCLLVGL
jgi:hypothetical protein